MDIDSKRFFRTVEVSKDAIRKAFEIVTNGLDQDIDGRTFLMSMITTLVEAYIQAEMENTRIPKEQIVKDTMIKIEFIIFRAPLLKD